MNANGHLSLGHNAWYAGQLDEAEAAYRKALDLNPQQVHAHRNLGLLYLARGKLREGLAEMEREVALVFRRQGLCLVYHALGRKKDADAALREHVELDAKAGAFQIAEVYAFRGEADRAFEWLERACDQRDGGLAFIKGDPLLRRIAGDPRHKALLRRLRLPPD